jgi:ferredoxin
MYNNLVIYFFSGTGNAKTAAHWIADNAEEKGLRTEIIRIDKDTPVPAKAFDENTLVGFCFPTHGFNTPPIVIDFLRRFPKSPNTRIFLLNTRAGMKLYKLFTPGMSGLALWWPALMLWLKGYKCIGYQPLDLPSNWISLHPGLRKKVVDSIFNRCKGKVDRFSKKVLDGKEVYQAFWGLPVDIAISPVSVLYYLFGRYALSKTYFASYACNHCDKCIKECPVHAVKYVDKRPYWTYKCESCMHCMNHCPEKAIETGHAFIFLLWRFAFISIPLGILHLLDVYKVIPEEILNSGGYGNIYKGLQYAVSIWVIFAGYRLMHYLLRYRWINYLITWTSLTKIKYWRRYKAPVKFLRLDTDKKAQI